eukprot:1408570-Amphidinium_carterae.1
MFKFKARPQEAASPESLAADHVWSRSVLVRARLWEKAMMQVQPTRGVSEGGFVQVTRSQRLLEHALAAFQRHASVQQIRGTEICV